MKYLRERVIEPILIPLVALALIAFGALNLSRLFLAAGHADRAVIVASLVSAAILAGAAWATSRDQVDRGVLLGGAALLGLVLSGAGLLAQQVDLDREAEAEGGEAAEAAGEITVTAIDIDFPTKHFETAGPGVKVTLENEGAGFHTFVVEGFEDEFKLETAGGTTSSGIVELEAGEFTFYCDVPGHRDAGMEGTLAVTEGGGGEAAEGGGGGGGGGAAGPPVRVTAVDIDFPETEFTAAAGEVAFEYSNEGAAFHTLVVDGHEDDMKLEAPGGETEKGSLDLEAGSYTLYCDVPGHRGAGMEATLTVT